MVGFKVRIHHNINGDSKTYGFKKGEEAIIVEFGDKVCPAFNCRVQSLDGTRSSVGTLKMNGRLFQKKIMKI